MAIYQSVIKGLKEAIEHEEGRVHAKTFTFDIKPLQDFNKERIRRIRKQAHMTQKVFSEFLGVSLKTVEAWEAGRNKPQGPAKRMLSMIEVDPNLFEHFCIIKEESETYGEEK